MASVVGQFDFLRQWERSANLFLFRLLEDMLLLTQLAFSSSLVLWDILCAMITLMNNLLEDAQYGALTSAPANSIVYNTIPTENGWIIDVKFPQSAPLSDKKSVLSWLQSYRKDIQDSHPLWTMSFSMSENRYRLEITRNDDARELFNSLLTKVATSWDEDPSYGR